MELRLEPVQDLLGAPEVDRLALREDEHLVEELVHLSFVVIGVSSCFVFELIMGGGCDFRVACVGGGVSE